MGPYGPDHAKARSDHAKARSDHAKAIRGTGELEMERSDFKRGVLGGGAPLVF